MEATGLTFERDGARFFPGAISAHEAQALASRLTADLDGKPGGRLLVGPEVQALLIATGPVGRIAASLIGFGAHPVRVVLFNKTRTANWTVAWHQDRTVAVRERHDLPGFGPWSTKDGLCHVAPPVRVLEGMATLRLHLDDCDDENAPLTVALGWHRLGLVPAREVSDVAADHAQFNCHAEAGDVWAY